MWEVVEPPRRVTTQAGADWWQVIRRSVRSYQNGLALKSGLGRSRSAYDAGFGVNLARERIDGDDMVGFIVPGATVLSPVCGRHFFPGVVECITC